MRKAYRQSNEIKVMAVGCSALKAANFMVFLLKDICSDLTSMKLMSLLYYAQGHSLKQYGKPLFDEKLYALEQGPCIQEVYSTYSAFHDDTITVCDEKEAMDLDDEIKTFLLDIARVYGQWTASALHNMVCVPHSPWNLTNNAEEIPMALIKQYFDHNESPIEPVNIVIHEDAFIGYHDESGVFVLPEAERE